MKTNRSRRFIHAALALAFLPVAGYAEKGKSAGTILPPSNAVVTITVTAAEPTALVPLTASASRTAPTQWTDIKDCTSAMRDSFFAGLTRLETMLNVQIKELTAQRATMTEASSTIDLDLALQEMRNARFTLKITGEKLSKATAQTWDQHKSKVGLAWGKSQEAYTKVKSRTAIYATTRAD